MVDLRGELQRLFGLEDFRPAQREVIEDVLGGRDVLCVMPTGAGKSLCYQLPGAVQGGLTIVVSPLISLMEDQVQQLRDEGLPAVLLNSALSAAVQRQVVAELREGYEGLLYVAPERFFAPNFEGLVGEIRTKLFVIDEAHCISQWGHDFRPEYARLGEIRQMLGRPPTIALTATATEEVRADIIAQLRLPEPRVYITGFDRPNLRYESVMLGKARDKEDALLEFLREELGSGIVYCATRKAVDAVTEMLGRTIADRKVFAYHAGMEVALRTANQERFMDTPRAIAVATNAFGMGINKPDLRWVLHYNMPGTLEAYYQEAGRAGRDGAPARCTMLFSYQDRYTQEFFIENIGQDNGKMSAEQVIKRQKSARDKLDMMVQYARTHRCRRQMILDYFGDETEIAGCQCDVCLRGRVPRRTEAPVVEMSAEAVTRVKQILSAVARLRGRFGARVVAEVLAGAENEKTQQRGLNHLTVFGLLRPQPVTRVVAMLHRVMEAGLARQKDPEGTKFRPVVELTPMGVAVMKGEQPPPGMLGDLAPAKSARGEKTGPGTARLLRGGRVEVETEPWDEEAAGRFERLRALRLRLAKEKQLPAYCVCNDETLKLMARRRPGNLEQLAEIKGMGPHKVRMYGSVMMEAIHGD